MRTILVPTDFSETARNAISYAIQVSQKVFAKVILLHANDRSTQLSDDEIMLKLENLKQELSFGYPHVVQMGVVCRKGKLNEVIGPVIKDFNIDLVILGTNGVSKVLNIAIGSNAAAVVESAHFPVLVVPPFADYKGTSRIVLAVDSQMDFMQVPISALRKLYEILGGDIFILSVINHRVGNIPEALMNVQKLNTLLKDIPHSFHYIYHDDVQKGINDFAEMQYADIIITLPKKHNWANRIFSRSHTRDMIYYIKTPVLALQE